MSKFANRGSYTPLSGGKLWEVMSPMNYEHPMGLITARLGFVSDFQSGIKIFRSYTSPATGKHRLAAVPHDVLYKFNPYNATRKECDQVYYDACIDEGVRKSKAKFMYGLLRSFGWAAWNKHRRNDG